MPFDFNQARVFTWNVRRHRYETAYRERGLNGVLPVTISHEDFGKEGDLPTFILRVKDPAGNTIERKYKMNSFFPGSIRADNAHAGYDDTREHIV